MSINPTVWGIRAGGEHFDAGSLFRSGEIGIGWSEAGDLAELPGDQQAIKAHLTSTHRKYPDITPHQIAQGAGALYRFKYVVKTGDIVVYDDKQTGIVYIGTVTGPYRFDLGLSAHAPHLRSVQWKRKLPRESVRTKLTVRGQTLWTISDPQEFRDLMED